MSFDKTKLQELLKRGGKFRCDPPINPYTHYNLLEEKAKQLGFGDIEKYNIGDTVYFIEFRQTSQMNHYVGFINRI